MTRLIQAYLMAALFCAAPAGVQAQTEQDPRQRYQDCMALTATRPNEAFDRATEWEGLNGGLPARHCALAALVELGHYYEAAQGLEHLAERATKGPDFAARLLVQAARAWLAADDPERAAQTAERAMALTPDAPDAQLLDALVVRARARAGLDAFWDVSDDLSRVLYVDPGHVEALVLRGAAYRQLQAFDLALDDLNRALAIRPDHPEGLLERGIVKRLQDDKAGARADWRTLIEAHPDSAAARSGEANLHALDSGLD